MSPMNSLASMTMTELMLFSTIIDTVSAIAKSALTEIRLKIAARRLFGFVFEEIGDGGDAHVRALASCVCIRSLPKDRHN